VLCMPWLKVPFDCSAATAFDLQHLLPAAIYDCTAAVRCQHICMCCT
jgi:hypothetical protein